MKISIFVPETVDLQNTRDFIKQESIESRNIKSDATRNQVESGLNLIIHSL